MYSKQSRMFVVYDSKNNTNTDVLHVEKNVCSMMCAS